MEDVDGLNVRRLGEDTVERVESQFESSNPARFLEDVIARKMSGVIIFSPKWVNVEKPDKSSLKIEAMYSSQNLETLLEREIREDLRKSILTQAEQRGNGTRRLVVVAEKLPIFYARLQDTGGIVIITGKNAEFLTQNTGMVINSTFGKLFESLMDVALSAYAQKKGEPAKNTAEVVREIKSRNGGNLFFPRGIIDNSS